MRTPLAWKNLTGNPRRLMLGAAGVSFAAVLMFMQNGFRYALLESPVQIVNLVSGDLIAISETRYTLAAEQRFPRQLLTAAAVDSSVAWVAPVYIERSAATIRVKDQTKRSIRVIGIAPDPKLFRSPQLREKVERIQAIGTGLIDVRSKSSYGFALDSDADLAAQDIELMDRRVRLLGTMDLGTDFAHDGNLLVSPQTLARFFPYRGMGRDPLSQLDFGLIELRPGEDAERVATRLTDLAPRQWKVLPREQLIASEMDFWASQTPIGQIFMVGILMGFAVGVIICYQILHTNIHDSMSELATLKAMGYTSSYFIGLVVMQSFYLSIIGFIPSVGISWLLFSQLQYFAGLPIFITVGRVAGIYALTLAMCVISGLLALRKLLKTDPASLF